MIASTIGAGEKRIDRERAVFLIERVLVRFYGNLQLAQDRRRLANQIMDDLDRAASPGNHAGIMGGE